MLIICYNETINSVTDNTFCEADSLESFRKNYPNRNIVHVFDKSSDLTEQETKASRHFMTYCYEYGFTPHDYKAVMIDGYGRKLTLVGFNPRNRKYKCLAVEESTGRRFKMTPTWVKTCLSRYQEANASEG